MEQPQYNLLRRSRVELEYAPLYSELGLGTTTWSPLASGLLTGKYDQAVPADTRLGYEGNEELQRLVMGSPEERRRERVRRFIALATEAGESPAPLAVAWCLRNPFVSTVITGASRVSQLLENLHAVELSQRYDDAFWDRLSAATS
jgi:aryl-alcohol dehydrogenase-like predicted oxidoreductase